MRYNSHIDGIDQNMIASVKNGSQQAFANLYDRFSPLLMGIITRITGMGKIAEDVLQQSFLEIWQRKESYDSSKERFFTWMIKIVLNVTTRVSKGNPGIENINLRDLVYGTTLANYQVTANIVARV